MRFHHLILTILLLWSASGLAQTTSKIDGLVYADYYYNLKNHSDSEQDRNAFAFRRIYFTFENNLTPAIKIRFRLESEHDKYGTEKKITPFVKHAYLEWSNLIPRHNLYLGIAETNAFKNSEEYWGYRSIEKTIMDLNKISSSADMGVALKGDLFGNVMHHWLTLFNGTGYGSSEIDRFKKIGYAFWLTPVRGLIIEGYADFENQDPDEAQTAAILNSAKDYTGSKGYYTWKGFLGYDHPRVTIGAEAFWRTNKKSGLKDVTIVDNAIASFTKADVRRFGYSVFASLITPIPRLKAFARYDYYDPNTEDEIYTKFDKGKLTGGMDDEFTLFIGGLDYIPQSNLHFMPNVMIQSYTKSGVETDITGRITVYYKFDSGKIVVE
ncbi:MAG: hypothetical protein ONB05_06205 [candidate division KSB1 bacterium]|nr:hypothetical protein [candidate division KSB1 bacterium]